MTSSNPYQQAMNAYSGTNEATMSGFEIVVELYKGIIKNIREAKIAHAEGNLEEMIKLIEKTNQILIALQSHINREEGGEAAEFLNDFYNGVFATLARIHKAEDPQAAFDKLLEDIQPVYEIWCRHAHGAAEENPTDNNGSGDKAEA